MKKVAVFGGEGFLGSYLVDELARRGYHVVSIDITPHVDRPDIAFIKADILDRQAVASVFQGQTFDFVYNLAGFANLEKAVHFPLETMQLNVIGNIHILEQIRAHNHLLQRFIYASSVYALSAKGSFYGISKLASEKIIEEYHQRFGLPFTILRYGSVYSEKAFDNNYIYNLIKKAIETGTIEHQGDGEEIREYIHAADAAKLSVDIIEEEKFMGKHVILTGVERLRRKELFAMINEILGGKLKIKITNDGYKEHYKYTPYSFDPRISEKLTPNPYIDMGQGLLNCIKTVYRST